MSNGSRILFTLLAKDFRIIHRERTALLFMLVLPLGIGIFFGFVAAGVHNATARYDVALVDLDGTEEAGWVRQQLDRSQRLRVHPSESENAAHAMVTQGRAAAALVLRQGLGDALADRTTSPGGPAATALIVDPARPAASAVLEAEVARVLGTRLLVSRLSHEDLAEAQQILSVERRDAIAPGGAFALTFGQAIIWAMIGSAASFASALVVEERAGTLLRLRALPIAPVHLILSKAAACWIMSMTTALLLVVIAVIGFGVTPSSWFGLMLGLAASAWAFVGVMMVVAVLGRRVAVPAQLAWGVLLILAMAGGAMMPIDVMPQWLASTSVVSPVRWSLIALDDATWRAQGFAASLPSLVALTTLGVAGLIVGYIAFVGRRRTKPLNGRFQAPEGPAGRNAAAAIR